MSGKYLPHWSIAAVTIASLALTIHVGSIEGINYDGWWHIFVARQEGWARFLAEIRANPHPPLYHLLLKASSSLGSERLAYRLVGIAATAASVLLVAGICQQLFRSRAMVVLATLTFGTSITAVTLANEVRSYALAGAFALSAVLGLLHILSEPRRSGRASALLAVALVLGILSHYGVLLLLPLFAIVPALLAARRPLWPPRLLLSLAPAAAVALVALGLHTSEFNRPMFYMPGHYYSADETLWAYLSRGARSELDLLTPLGLDSLSPAVGGLVLLGLAGGVLALLARLRTRGESAPAALLLLFVGLVVETFLASLIGWYPFGGLLRHQYFVFLLGFLACFLVLDQLIAAIPSGRVRLACLAALWIVVPGQALARWQAHEIDRVDRPAEQVRQALRTLPGHAPILVRRTSLINLFAHHHRSRWRFVGRVPNSSIEEWRIRTPMGEIVLYRRLGGWLLLLDDPETYRDVQTVLDATSREGGTREPAAIATIEVRHGAVWNRSGWKDRRQMLETIHGLARQHELTITNLQISAEHSVARFRLRGSPQRDRSSPSPSPTTQAEETSQR